MLCGNPIQSSKPRIEFMCAVDSDMPFPIHFLIKRCRSCTGMLLLWLVVVVVIVNNFSMFLIVKKESHVDALLSIHKPILLSHNTTQHLLSKCVKGCLECSPKFNCNVFVDILMLLLLDIVKLLVAFTLPAIELTDSDIVCTFNVYENSKKLTSLVLFYKSWCMDDDNINVGSKHTKRKIK